jgi:predicted alpha/beta hydrolase family esterase
MKAEVLMVPGLWNSGPQSWQTLWQAEHPEYRRVMQRDWEHPVCKEWVRTLDEYVSATSDDDGVDGVVLVAHSLGCATVVHWAAQYAIRVGAERIDDRRKPALILGALLVAPSDVEALSYPKEAFGFEPMPMALLPFRSTVVASSNDPYVTVERAEAFAAAWGSKFVSIGEAGHINADSGHGPWETGKKYLQELAG